MKMKYPETANNVLVTCGGKWVGIILQLREAMRRHPAFVSARIVVASSDELTPAGCFADEAVQVPLIRVSDYVDCLSKVCRSRSIRVLVPLIDLDLERLAPELALFRAMGTTVVCPPPRLTELCLDKLRFAGFAEQNDLPHPRTFVYPDLQGLAFPAYYKRRRGFGSIGSGICRVPGEAVSLAEHDPNILFQQKVDAPEVTVDAYISRTGKCIVCVPRIRDKVVAGEAYKSHTIRVAEVERLAMRTINALATEGLHGPLNVQIFHTSPPMLLEVNTRLGSASVLSNMAAGGRLLDALLNEAVGGTSEGDPSDYLVGLQLNRFLGDVFHSGTKVVAVKPQ
jgi:carbamoyl-phosphate synthase large subunit